MAYDHGDKLMPAQKKIPEKHQEWIAARKRFCLTHAQVQMARELGMNPRKFGKIANHDQERWKAPLPVFIEDCYFKRFGKILSNSEAKSVEQLFNEQQKKKAACREQKLQKKTDGPPVISP